MRPVGETPAHRTGLLAELVCSNSLRSDAPSAAVGCLKAEMRALGSLVLRCAEAARVPGGAGLAVDRVAFAEAVTRAVEAHPRIRVAREETRDLPEAPAVVATGPLTSPAMADALSARLGARALHFHDAVAPIVEGASLDRSRLFSASRWGTGDREEGDFLNAPLSREAYEALVAALLAADRHEGIAEDRVFFEGCLPIEEMARRGPETLRHGPWKPIGLVDPATGRRPHAVVQLRREDLHGDFWNLVGFQTQLRLAEQERIFRTIPGLERADFSRHGSVHRNTYLDSPALLTPCLEIRPEIHPGGLFIAGQLAGVEGYVESAAAGLAAGIFAAARARGGAPRPLPEGTILGGLLAYVSRPHPEGFQPMKAQWGLVPPAPPPAGRRPPKRTLREAATARAVALIEAWRGSERG